MKPGTVLVTGITGFVGPHLLRALRAESALVHGVGPEPRTDLTLDAWHVADVRQPVPLAAAVAHSRPDAVIHLAGQSSAAVSFENPAETFAVNCGGTWNVLQAVRQHAPRARVLVVGTSEVYGPQAEPARAAEDDRFQPVSPYALSKAVADAITADLARHHSLDAMRARSFGHTGPGQSPRFVVPAFAEQIARIEAGQAEPVLRVGNLEVTRDLLDVRDVVRAYVALIADGRSGAAYNVCRGSGVRLSDVARRLAERSRVPVRIEVDPARLRPADVPYLVGNPSAIERDTGWRPDIAFERTLDDVLDDWRGRIRAS